MAGGRSVIMGKVTVWTKQSKDILKELEETGRYTAKKKYIMTDLEEHKHLVFEVYDWLVRNTPNAKERPEDAEYPVWVSLKQETTMLKTPNAIILELSIDEELLTYINIDKWGMILNYSYIPSNENDLKAHQKMLSMYGVSDVDAYMSQFYPQIKREIVDSWKRLFDESIIIHNSNNYGNIWEVKKEWIVSITE